MKRCILVKRRQKDENGKMYFKKRPNKNNLSGISSPFV
jgi:hypothetical protein